MLDWLIDPPSSVYYLLLVALLVMGFLWYRSRKRADLVRVGVVLAVLIGWGLADLCVESDREQCVRKVREMAAGIAARDAERILAHVSDRFGQAGLDKAVLWTRAQRALSEGEVNEATVWNFDRDQFRRLGPDEVEQAFLVKVKGAFVPEGRFALCRARFVRDSDGQLRLKSFALYQPPPLNTDEKIQIPGLTE